MLLFLARGQGTWKKEEMGTKKGEREKKRGQGTGEKVFADKGVCEIIRYVHALSYSNIHLSLHAPERAPSTSFHIPVSAHLQHESKRACAVSLQHVGGSFHKGIDASTSSGVLFHLHNEILVHSDAASVRAREMTRDLRVRARVLNKSKSTCDLQVKIAQVQVKSSQVEKSRLVSRLAQVQVKPSQKLTSYDYIIFCIQN